MTAKKPDGGQAFPSPSDLSAFGNYGPRDGMTLRDWFAGQAVAVLIGHTTLNSWKSEDYATRAYEVADAMIAERDK